MHDIFSPFEGLWYIYSVLHDCDYNVTFKSLVRFDVFTEELADLHAYIKLFNKESTTPLKKVTKISTVCDVLSKKPTSKKSFLEIRKLLQIYCGVALVSTFAEKSFSLMRKIKTWVRSNMRDNSLNN